MVSSTTTSPNQPLAGHGRAERLGGGDQTLEGFFTSRDVVFFRNFRHIFERGGIFQNHDTAPFFSEN